MNGQDERAKVIAIRRYDDVQRAFGLAMALKAQLGGMPASERERRAFDAACAAVEELVQLANELRGKL